MRLCFEFKRKNFGKQKSNKQKKKKTVKERIYLPGTIEELEFKHQIRNWDWNFIRILHMWKNRKNTHAHRRKCKRSLSVVQMLLHCFRVCSFFRNCLHLFQQNRLLDNFYGHFPRCSLYLSFFVRIFFLILFYSILFVCAVFFFFIMCVFILMSVLTVCSQ